MDTQIENVLGGADEAITLPPLSEAAIPAKCEYLAVLLGWMRSARESNTLISDCDFTTLVDIAVDEVGISMAELAIRFGVSVGTISRWRSGTARPTAMARRGVLEEIIECTMEVQKKKRLRRQG